MTDKPPKKSQPVTTFSSASEETRWRRDDDRKANSGQGGANAKPSEVTVLERRVLAYERILLALIGHLAEDDSEILTQLKTRFGSGHDLGEYEQDFVSTDQYGEHFIRSIEAEVQRRKQGY